MSSTPAVSHVSGGLEYYYPDAGDPKPPGGAQVHILTRGGICVRGTWADGTDAIGWARFPLRNKEKEAQVEAVHKQRKLDRLLPPDIGSVQDL